MELGVITAVDVGVPADFFPVVLSQQAGDVGLGGQQVPAGPPLVSAKRSTEPGWIQQRGEQRC